MVSQRLARFLKDAYRKHSISPPPTILSETVNDVSAIDTYELYSLVDEEIIVLTR